MSDDTIIVGSSTSSSMYVDRWSRVCVYGSRDDACAQMTEHVCSVAHAAPQGGNEEVIKSSSFYLYLQAVFV